MEMLKAKTKKFNGRSYKISPLKEGPYKKGLVKNLMKARRMSEGQRRSAVARKRAAGNTGPKPTNVKTFSKRKNAMGGGFMAKRQRMGII